MCVKRYNREAIERSLDEARDMVATCPIAHVDMWAERVTAFKAELSQLEAFETAVKRLIAAQEKI